MHKKNKFLTSSLLKLKNSLTIPTIGLGTWEITTEEAISQALDSAFEHGYSLIDTARVYHNEHHIGKYLKANKRRPSTFITTKIDVCQLNYQLTGASILQSLESLQTDYIDLMLLHWPEAKSPADRHAAWRALEDYHKKGALRSIGVSNFLPMHLDKLTAECEVQPMVNQIEIHPLNIDLEVIEYCRARGIVIQAYCPLARMSRELLSSKVLLDVSARLGKKPTQVLLKWSIQKGFCVLPKSSNRDRIRENRSVGGTCRGSTA